MAMLKCYEGGHEFPASGDTWYPEDGCYRCPVCASPSLDPKGDAAAALREVWEALKQM